MLRRMSTPLRYCIVLFIAAVALALVYLFPPYTDLTAFLGGSGYSYFKNPFCAEFGEGVCYVTRITVNMELAFIVLSICSAFIALSPNAKRKQKILFSACFGLEVMIFISGILCPALLFAVDILWDLLGFTSFVLLGTMLFMNVKQQKPHRQSSLSANWPQHE